MVLSRLIVGLMTFAASAASTGERAGIPPPRAEVDELLVLVRILDNLYGRLNQVEADGFTASRSSLTARAARFESYVRENHLSLELAESFRDFQVAVDDLGNFYAGVAAARSAVTSTVDAETMGRGVSSGLAAYQTLGAASELSQRAGGSGLSGGQQGALAAGVAIFQIASDAWKKGEERDRQRAAAVQTQIDGYCAKYQVCVSNLQATCRQLARDRHWATTETGLELPSAEVEAMQSAIAKVDYIALHNIVIRQQISRPRDHTLFQFRVDLADGIRPLQLDPLVEAGKNCFTALSLLPSASVYDEDRDDLASSGALALMDAIDDRAGEKLQADLLPQIDRLLAVGEAIDPVDASGGYRLFRCRYLLQKKQADAALTQLRTLQPQFGDHPNYWLLAAKCNAANNDPDKALSCLRTAIDHGCSDIAAVHDSRRLDTVRRDRPQQYAELLNMKTEWSMTWGAFNDDLVVRNKTLYAWSNISLSGAITFRGKSFPISVKLARLAPGEAHTFPSCVSVTGSGIDTARITLTCDQGSIALVK